MTGARLRRGALAVLVLALTVGVAGGVYATQWRDGGRDTGALDDGVVTRAEYRAAVNSVVECTRAGGASIVAQPVEDGLFYSFHVSAASDAELDVADQTFLECERQHLSAIETAWVTQHHVSDRAAIEAAVAAAADCLRAADVALPEGAQSALDQGLSRMDDRALDTLVQRFTGHVSRTRRPEAAECAQEAGLYRVVVPTD